MTNLERRALLGDREAQRECTEQGIAIACPHCGCESQDMISLSVSHEQYYYSCEECGCSGPIVCDSDQRDYPEHDALEAWNTRPAPLIGRCGDCRHSGEPSQLTVLYGEPGTLTCHHGLCNRRNVNEKDSCSYFEAKAGGSSKDLTLGELRNGAIVFFEGAGAYEVVFKIGEAVYMKPAPPKKEE